MNAQGFNFKVGSLLTLLSGGIAFETPHLDSEPTKPSPAGTHFLLHRDFADISSHTHIHKETFLMYFDKIPVQEKVGAGAHGRRPGGDPRHQGG